MKMKRTCSICDGIFFAARNARYCPTCRAERDAMLRREALRRRREGSARTLGTSDLCVICSAVYVVKEPHDKYCSRECAAIGLRKYYAHRYRARRERLTTAPDANKL